MQRYFCAFDAYPSGYISEIALPSYPYSSTPRGILTIILVSMADPVPPLQTPQIYFCILATRLYPPIFRLSDIFVSCTEPDTAFLLDPFLLASGLPASCLPPARYLSTRRYPVATEVSGKRALGARVRQIFMVFEETITGRYQPVQEENSIDAKREVLFVISGKCTSCNVHLPVQ